jgi:autotransporter-associated beta strand protein
MNTIRKLRNGCVAIIALSLSLLATSVFAADKNWKGGSGNWSDAAGWDGGAWVNDSTAVFGGTAGTVTNDAGGVSANGLTFNTANYIINGTLLTLTGTTPAIVNAVSATINADLGGSAGLSKLGNGTLFLGGTNSSLSGTLTIAGATSGNSGGVQMQSTAACGSLTAVTIANNSFLYLGNATLGSDATITVSGGGGFTTPPGAIRGIAGASAVNGPVALADTAVRFGNGGTSTTFNGPVTAPVGSNRGLMIRNALNLGVIFTNTANYWEANTTLAEGSVYFYPGALPASSKLLIAGSGNAWFETNGSFTRPLGTTSAGQVDMYSNLAAGRIKGLSARGGDLTVNFGGAGATVIWGSTAGFNPDVLGLAGANATGTLTLENPIDLNAALREINVANGSAATDAVLNGTLSGTGASGLTKTGNGVLLLAKGNTYSGATFINAGTLRLGLETAIPTANAVTIAGGVYDLNGFGAVVNGAITVSSGSITNGTLTGSAYSLSGGTVYAHLAGAIGLTKAVSTTVATLANSNTYSGGTTISGSQGAVNPLRLTHSDALSTKSLTIGGGGNDDRAVLQLAGNITVTNTLVAWTSRSGDYANIQNISGTNTVTSNFSSGAGGSKSTLQSDAGLLVMTGQGALRTLNLSGAGNGRVEGPLSLGAYSLRKLNAGTWTTTGANTYSGITEILGGTLQFGNGGTTGNLGSGSVANSANLAINRSDSYTIPNVIYGSGSLTLSGAGTITLTTTNLYTGATVVNNGSLVLGCNNALADNNPLTLNGVTFDAGSFSNNLGTLTLATGTTNILLVNGSATSLSFTNMALAATGTLTIIGNLEPTALRFGTDANGLTKTQLSKISTRGYQVYLDTQGYLHEKPTGTVIRFL